MMAINGAIVCLAYVLGLLLTAIPGTLVHLPLGAILLLLTGAIASRVMPRFWRTGPKAWTWLVAGCVGAIASLYFQSQVPVPTATDICHVAPTVVNSRCTGQSVSTPGTKSESIEITGTIHSSPRLTRGDRLQFELTVSQFQQGNVQPQTADGLLYVTVPRAQDSEFYLNRAVAIAGSLYQPKAAANPGGFNFQHYLARQGIFAGMTGQTVRFLQVEQQSPPLIWQVRQRIIQAQTYALGDRIGNLLSAMVMGRASTNVPYDVQDQFATAGMAHVLAASGFQVSLLVGVLLALTQRLRPLSRLGIGLGVIAIYVSLTGLEAPALRAGLMGAIVLVALTVERRVKTLMALLLVATAMLVYDPLWIWDLGFQMSFLATLGLLVTVPTLTQWLDWLPSGINSLITVPVAAYLWLLPILLHSFGVVSLYGIPINVLTSPLVSFLSMAGMVDALIALIYPPLGALVAGWLYWPMVMFMKIVEIGAQLPGSSWATGTIHAVQVWLLYGLFVAVWWRWRAQWFMAAIAGLALLVLPMLYTASQLTQITVLATDSPVILVQDRGRVGLAGEVSAQDAQFTLVPFLKRQGINRLDWAIAPDLSLPGLDGWRQLNQAVPMRQFYDNPTFKFPANSAATQRFTDAYTALLQQIKTHDGANLRLSPGQAIAPFGEAIATLLSPQPSVLHLNLHQQDWLLLDWMQPVSQRRVAEQLSPANVLWWPGGALTPELLAAVRPQIAVTPARAIAASTQTWFQQHGVTLYQTSQDGAVQWTPEGFRTMLNRTDF